MVPARMIVLVLAALSTCNVFADPPTSQPAAPAEEREPQFEVSVVVDGQKVDIGSDGTGTVTIEGKPRPVRVAIQPEKELRTKHLRFRYLQHFAFEFEGETPGLQMWTLDGNDVTMILMRYAEEISPSVADDIADNVATSLGRAAKATKGTCELKLGGTTHKGTQRTIEFAGNRMTCEVYVIPSGGRRHVLSLQDMLTDDGKHTQEYAATIKLLSATWRDQ